MSRGEILLPLACLLLFGGGSLFFSHETPTPQITAHINAQQTAKPHHPVPEQETTPQTDVAAPQKIETPQPEVTPPAPIIPDIPLDAADTLPSSWEAPFSADLWLSTGWMFSKDSMTSAAESAAATFRRPYHKLMLECDLLATETPGSRWELQLATRNGQVVMSLILSEGKLAVVTTENGLAHVAMEKPLTVPLSNTTPRHFRVVATGNRIVISWDRKRFLTTEQLAAQSGKEIVWSIHTTGTAYQISNLRIEGD